MSMWVSMLKITIRLKKASKAMAALRGVAFLQFKKSNKS